MPGDGKYATRGVMVRLIFVAPAPATRGGLTMASRVANNPREANTKVTT